MSNVAKFHVRYGTWMGGDFPTLEDAIRDADRRAALHPGRLYRVASDDPKGGSGPDLYRVVRP